MKSKRWKRRNRHTRPEWVAVWKEARLYCKTHHEWYQPVFDEFSQLWGLEGTKHAWYSFALN